MDVCYHRMDSLATPNFDFFKKMSLGPKDA